MSAGQILVGHPWAGVCLGIALMCGAVLDAPGMAAATLGTAGLLTLRFYGFPGVP